MKIIRSSGAARTALPIFVLSLFFLLLLFPTSASARTWSGIVIDATTGEPIPEVSLKAGVRGRVDAFPGYEVFSNQRGEFSVTWPAANWPSSGDHYLRISAAGYFGTTVVRPQPEQRLTVTMVPLHAHIRGQLVDGVTGNPLPGIRVALGAGGPGAASPGAVRQSLDTDADGFFAFDSFRLFANESEVFDYPSTMNLQYRNETGPYNSVFLTIYGSREHVNEWIEISPATIKPSVDGSVYTFVTFRAQEYGTAAPNPVIRAELRGRLRSSYGQPSAGDPCVSSATLEVMAAELRTMIERAETNNAAHPNFIADLQRWLGELEAELSVEPTPQWGTY